MTDYKQNENIREDLGNIYVGPTTMMIKINIGKFRLNLSKRNPQVCACHYKSKGRRYQAHRKKSMEQSLTEQTSAYAQHREGGRRRGG
jgi:hypothetical protein